MLRRITKRLARLVPHTLVEVIVLGAVAAVLVSLLGDPAFKQWQLDRCARLEVKSFLASPSPSLTLPSEWIRPSGDLAGRWRVRRGRSGSYLTFSQKPNDGGRYQVAFQTQNCMQSWQMAATATCGDGVIELDSPLAEISAGVFQKLYCLQVGGKVALIPVEDGMQLEEIRVAIETAEDQHDWGLIERFAFFRDQE